MLAVLTTMCSSLRHTRSTQDTSPRRIASTVLATLSQPMSLAKWLKVPPGKTASGIPCSTAMPAAHDTVPSPPPTASTSARLAASRNASSMSSSSPSSTISALGNASRTSSTTRAPVPLPDAGLITSTTPAPSGRGSVVSTRSGSAVGIFVGDDRRHDPSPEHRDARSDAEAREHVARIVRADGDAGQADQTGQQCEPQSDGRALQPDTDGERGGAGRVPGRQRVRRREASALPGQGHQHAVGPWPFPDTLGELVGDQAGHGQAHDSAHGASGGCLVSRRHQCRSDDEPQFGMIGGPAQPGHGGVQQRARRLRDRLEDLAIEGAETLADLGQAAADPVASDEIA